MALVRERALDSKPANLERASNSSASSSMSDHQPGARRGGRRLLDYLANRGRVPFHQGAVVNLARNHSPFLYRMNLMKKLPVHDGCVNTICWNKTGEYILSGSDDCNLCITKPTYMFDDRNDYAVLHKVPTRHLGNIFSAQFLPNSNDSLLVSCSSEGPVIVHDINSNNPSHGIFNFNCHSSTIFEVVTLPDDDRVFLSCGEDKTVRLFDLRCHRSCARSGTCPHPALIRNSHPMTTLSVHPSNSNLLLVGRADGVGLVYDRRKLPDVGKFSREKAHAEQLANAKSGAKPKSSFKYLHPLDGVISQFSVPDMNEKCRFTSLCFSQNGSQVLASYSQDYIYLFNLDKSTNFELIQTLPRNNPNRNDDNDDNRDMNNNNSERAANQTGRVRTRGSGSRAPRIRVRGDWSDTGIYSVPHSRSEDNSNQQAPNFLQRMTEMAFTMNARRSSVARLVPRTELIAIGNLPGNDSSNATIDEERNEDDDDDDEDDHEESGLVSELSFVECESAQGEQEEGSKDNDDADLDTSDSGTAPVMADGRMHSPLGTGGGKPQVSEETKMKFRRTFDELKDRFNKIPTYHPRVRYQGHRNSRTSIKEAIFWGDDYIMSGSDCGRILIWEKDTAKLVMGFPADERVVNCLAPNPHHYALASSGIDYDIKLWSTQSILDCPLKASQKEMDMIVKNNELMLEEAKQTITVPPHLFFRVIASFAQNRLS